MSITVGGVQQIEIVEKWAEYDIQQIEIAEKWAELTRLR